MPKFLVISTYRGTKPNIWQDSFVKDYLPEPPTPISIILPRGYLKTRAIREIWSIASSKNTKFILVVAVML